MLLPVSASTLHSADQQGTVLLTLLYCIALLSVMSVSDIVMLAGADAPDRVEISHWGDWSVAVRVIPLHVAMHRHLQCS